MRLFLLAALIAIPVAAAPPPLVGTWRNPSGSVDVDMRRCGDAMCGVVVRANERAVADAGAGGTDRLVGSQLFRDLHRDGAARWSGEVFVPDLGRTVEGTLTVVDRSTLEVEGCVIAGFACQSQVWTRTAPRR